MKIEIDKVGISFKFEFNIRTFLRWHFYRKWQRRTCSSCNTRHWREEIGSVEGIDTFNGQIRRIFLCNECYEKGVTSAKI